MSREDGMHEVACHSGADRSIMFDFSMIGA